MKIAVLFYHKNALDKYDIDWIYECLESIHEQTWQKYDIYELNYGERKIHEDTLSFLQVFEEDGFFDYHMKRFEETPFNNHIGAMNYMLNKLFNKFNYDIVFNANLDDSYDKTRFGKQIEMTKKYELIGSLYNIVNHNTIKKTKTNLLDEEDEQSFLKVKTFNDKKCIIPLSSMCFTKKSWDVIKEIPEMFSLESLFICKKILKNNMKIHTIQEPLVNYRIHENQYSANIRNNIL